MLLKRLETRVDLLSDLGNGLLIQLDFVVETLDKFKSRARILLNLLKTFIDSKEAHVSLVSFLGQAGDFLLRLLHSGKQVTIDPKLHLVQPFLEVVSDPLLTANLR